MIDSGSFSIPCFDTWYFLQINSYRTGKNALLPVRYRLIGTFSKLIVWYWNRGSVIDQISIYIFELSNFPPLVKILCLKVHKHEIFLFFFCRNWNLMVPRACNTRFLKIVFDSAEIFDFYTFLRMLSMRWNRFSVCSACIEISSPYARCAIKFVPRMLSMDCTCKNVHILPLAEHPQKFVPRMLSMRWNRFRVCSAYACCNFRKWLKNP